MAALVRGRATDDFVPEGAQGRVVREARWMAAGLCCGGADADLDAGAAVGLDRAGAAGPAVPAAVSSGRTWRLPARGEHVPEHADDLHQPAGAVSGLEHALPCRAPRLARRAVPPAARGARADEGQVAGDGGRLCGLHARTIWSGGSDLDCRTVQAVTRRSRDCAGHKIGVAAVRRRFG